MQAEPHVEKCTSAILFWPWAHVIVKGVSNGPVHYDTFYCFRFLLFFFLFSPSPPPACMNLHV